MQFCMSLTWQWVNPGIQDFCIANRSFFHMDINCKGVLGEGRVFSHHLGIPHLPWVSHKTNAKPTNIFKSDLVVLKISSLISKFHTHIYIYLLVYTTCLLVQEFPNVRFPGKVQDSITMMFCGLTVCYISMDAMLCRYMCSCVFYFSCTTTTNVLETRTDKNNMKTNNHVLETRTHSETIL